MTVSAALVFFWSCTWDLPDYWGKSGSDIDTDIDASADTDTDTDTDTSTDTDSDSDTDTGSDTETDSDGGTDGDTDTDADTDCDSDDTESSCEEDAGADSDTDTDTDTDTATDPPVEWDGGTGDYDEFCGNPDFGKYTDKVNGIAFDYTGAPYRGNILSPEVEITGFSFFGCPHCADAAVMMEDIFSDPAYSERAVYYFSNFYWYDDMTKTGWDGHKAAHAAHRQGRFWPMHDMIFEADDPAGEDFFMFASELGVEMKTFSLDFNSEETADCLLADRTEGVAAGVTGTPTFFINGHKVCQYQWNENDQEWVCANQWSKIKEILDCLFGY
jgi:protein-disulfide isomerase